ncbi:MAG: phosphoribosylanthranilate isomerase [Planctomycetes bacterium]|nr:phosphoribosylanthranilate isomerase [Planctomycetota bacterium]
MSKLFKIKICGITNYADAAYAVDCGADALGFVMAPSPRQVSFETARKIIMRLPLFIVKAGVFVDMPIDNMKEIMEYCGLTVAQLHGRESRKCLNCMRPFAYKAFRAKNAAVLKEIKEYGCGSFLLDSYSAGKQGGTGILPDLRIAQKASLLGKMILAGGLTPENVSRIVAAVKPYGVDVSSGVESSPGKKDKAKLKAFFNEFKM